MNPGFLLGQRDLIARGLEGLSDEQLTTIPAGRRNHILWNVGHIITSHQLLTYRLAGLDLRIPPRYVALFARGTSPQEWSDGAPDARELLSLLRLTAEHFVEDVAAGRFERFERFELTSGIVFETLEDAMLFDHFHEGAHFGFMLSIRKELGGGGG